MRGTEAIPALEHSLSPHSELLRILHGLLVPSKHSRYSCGLAGLGRIQNYPITGAWTSISLSLGLRLPSG